MKPEYLTLLRCPKCQSTLMLKEQVFCNGRVRSGEMHCENNSCAKTFIIEKFIPRFVTSNYYVDSFGPQWKTFAKTQLDDSQFQESQIRFRSEIGWDDLSGKTVIELGSGAGRFVDVVSKLGPLLVVGLDASDAVDAARENLGDRDNVFIVQADIFNPPFPASSTFDLAYSIGVMHHTPDPLGAFGKMVGLTKIGGKIGVSLYEISLYHRPSRNSLRVSTLELLWAINLWRCEFFRVFTTRVPNSLFLKYCKYFVPILHWLNKIPVFRFIRYLFPSTCYKDLPVEWSMLDTHDTYATKIVHQYRHKEIFQWFLKFDLHDIVINNGRSGWVSLTGTKKDSPLPVEMKRAITSQPRGLGL